MTEKIGNADSSEITLSVAVTAHAEGRLLRPTIRSIASAIALLVERSVPCELLIVLDNPTDATAREAERWQEPGRIDVPVRIIRETHGDAGASRNAAAREARGQYLALCDGDDLVSRNYFSEALKLLAESDSRVIIHPGTVVSFGARGAVWVVPSSEAVDHLELIRNNMWPSSSVADRSVYTEIPYMSVPPEDGFGPEDWLWNIQTTIAGIPHLAAPGTMFFYRVRASGGVNNRHLNSILPWFDIDGLIRALPIRNNDQNAAHQTRSRPTMRSVIALVYRWARPAIRRLTSSLSQDAKEKLYARVTGIHLPSRAPRNVLSDEVLAALRDAAEIEPALTWTAAGYATQPQWLPPSDVYASLLVTLVAQLRGKADALVAVPWVGVGGADLVSLNYARALVASERFGRNVSMLATYLPSRTIRHLVPEGVGFVQIPETFRTLRPDLQRRLLAQVFLLVRPRLVVSVNCFDVTNSLQLYGHQMSSTSEIYLTLFAFDRIDVGYPTNPITDDSQRQYLDEIGGLLTDNTVTAALIEEMLALDDTRVSVHHQPAMDSTPALRTGTRAYNDQHFSAANPFKLLWPHRLDKEKRPDALVKIANRLKAESLPVEIHVYGQQVLSTDGKELMKSLEEAGIKYHGPYTGGLASLPTYDYHALLLTSESEGLPLVLVQSMLLGLPVIASAVGGVVDIVIDRETGILANGPDDVDGFVAGIRLLFGSLDERRQIIHAAYHLAESQHGWTTFAHLAESLG